MVILAVSMALSVVLIAGNEERKSVATARPSVVKTIPQCGDTQVDPQTRKISVTYSKEMMDKNWSLVTADEGKYPETVGQPKYLADKKTCVVEVKLKPKTTYAIWLNSDKFHNFKDKDGRPAVPYLLVFETK
jgi:RNA polymerase sigma-70 factor (ECF subfamily)